jgi:hypothetical protein
MGTTVNNISLIGNLWDKLGFDDIFISPYMDKFKGCELYDEEVRSRSANRVKNPGYFMTHADARLLIT